MTAVTTEARRTQRTSENNEDCGNDFADVVVALKGFVLRALRVSVVIVQSSPEAGQPA